MLFRSFPLMKVCRLSEPNTKQTSHQSLTSKAGFLAQPHTSTGSHTGPAHSRRLLPPSFTGPSPEQELTHRPCLACRRRHHGARRLHHPARIHPHAPVAEPPQRHAAGIRRRPCGRCNTTPPLVPSSQHLLQNDAPRRENDTEGAVIVRSGRPRSRVSPGTSRSG